jgi:2-alkyl-3-oxoalkanoate reductase
MRIFVAGAEGAIGARLATQLTGHGHQVIGTRRSPRNAGRVRGLSAGPAALGRPARVRPRIGGSS